MGGTPKSSIFMGYHPFWGTPMAIEPPIFCHPQIDGKVNITIKLVGIYFSIYLGMPIDKICHRKLSDWWLQPL